GDIFRVNGHKIWTTQAHLSRWCTLYARTDPDAPKHRGISCLILDLHAPGVTIEPIRMASISDETFCESSSTTSRYRRKTCWGRSMAAGTSHCRRCTMSAR